MGAHRHGQGGRDPKKMSACGGFLSTTLSCPPANIPVGAHVNDYWIIYLIMIIILMNDQIGYLKFYNYI